MNFESFYFWIILSQFILEAGLFFAAAVSVRWPQPALVRSKELSVAPQVNRMKGIAKGVEVVADEHPGLIQDTCLLIACHQSCLTKDAQFTFSNTVRCAMKIFPASAIFVCDNGNSLNPVDRTEEVCEELSMEVDNGHERIQYVYIPEGNKTHAMYWTTEYWIPELVRRKASVDFSYCLMIDDDVPLPPDLHVPLHTLSRQPEIKAVSYVIMAATEGGHFNQLVALQDAEYKLAGFVKQFQWNFGSTMACHGAIGLWRRDVLGKKILWDHDTVFHGEDLYMGLLLHRMKKNYTIMVSAGAVVPTFAPENMLTLFRQRVTSWDLCAQRKFLTYLKEMLGGVCNTRTYILKPFLLQEVINILLDWCRIYLMVGLGHRNMIALMLCFLVFYALLYFEIILFNFMVLRDRADLRMSPTTVLVFPFYRTWCLIFRLYALLRNLIMYSAWTRKYVKISIREQDMHDIPPVPTVPDPDWYTIWHQNKPGKDGDRAFHSLVRTLCAKVEMEDQQELARFKLMAEAALLYNKLLRENAEVSFPQVLGVVQRSPTESEMLGRTMEALRLRFFEKLGELIGPQYERFERRFDNALKKWSQLNAYLFFDPKLRGSGAQYILDILRSNLHILQSIDQVIGRTRWPASHDKAAVIKAPLQRLIDHMIDKIEELENSDEANNMRHMLPHGDESAGAPVDGLQALQMECSQSVQQVQNILNRNDVAEFPRARAQLSQVRSAAHRIDSRSQWRAQLLMACDHLQQRLDERSGPMSVSVEAQHLPPVRSSGSRVAPQQGGSQAYQPPGAPAQPAYRGPR